MQKIIAVADQKKGVGKTTISINFAAGLARENNRVLLIDLDPQANSTIGLGIEPGSFQYAIHNAIRNLDHDFIVIDCRPTLGTLTVNAMFASNFILVPCLTSRFSLEGFSDLLDTFETVKNSEDTGKKHLIRILINNLDTRKKIMRDWVWNELEPFKEKLFETKIRQDEALNRSQAAGKPVFAHNERNPLNLGLYATFCKGVCSGAFFGFDAHRQNAKSF